MKDSQKMVRKLFNAKIVKYFRRTGNDWIFKKQLVDYKKLVECQNLY